MNRIGQLVWLAIPAISVISVLSASPLMAQTDAAKAPQQKSSDSADASGTRDQQQAVDRAIRFLEVRGQADDGSFSGETGVAVTALCVRAILEHRPRAIDTPTVRKGIAIVLATVSIILLTRAS